MCTENQAIILSSRQARLVELFAQGLTKQEIAKRLHRSYSAVAQESDNLRRALGCKNITHLVAYCIEKNLINKTEA